MASTTSYMLISFGFLASLIPPLLPLSVMIKPLLARWEMIFGMKKQSN